MLNPQLDRRGELIHLLTTEGLPKRHVERLLDAARACAAAGDAGSPAAAPTPHAHAAPCPVFLSLDDDLADRDAYAALATRLSLLPVVLDPQDEQHAQNGQSAQRAQHPQHAQHAPDVHVPSGAPAGTAHMGDALAETVARLQPGVLVLRHAASGAAHCAAAHAAPGLRVINAGDGSHADPLPALALIQAMLHAKQDLTNLAVTLVGDIRHSRVARSVIHAMTTLGVPEVRVVAPRTLLPEGLPQLGVRECATLHDGLQAADVIIVLPLQVERISGALLPSAREYAHAYGLTPATLAGAKPDALLLPGGALTPGVEVDGDVAAGLPPVQAQLADLEQHLRLAALSVLAGDAP
ncbi:MULTISPECIES: aspartate carbamoyltransferase [Achromobacter]|uniref:Aspartate carbamoyltransferase n=1 Tax=Achromobacter spanius TaxID=217203 RepID=A0ABY8GQI7_9BURK|nr:MULTISPECIES: aspartate carbamoyltransferase [Achromobacter]WAI83650.1 aspartate carbamoyltransferase [Achromobacter spanius]WEX93732.1 aspartate carbamoyltransferase [Achromobacter sp. SS2-2022]WFP07106.1 aspartate carbamoyltransferase [Achromobacter spanius]